MKNQFNEMGKRSERWVQKIEDRIKGQTSTRIQVHQSNHEERDLKWDEAAKLDKPAVSHTPGKRIHRGVKFQS